MVALLSRDVYLSYTYSFNHIWHCKHLQIVRIPITNGKRKCETWELSHTTSSSTFGLQYTTGLYIHVIPLVMLLIWTNKPHMSWSLSSHDDLYKIVPFNPWNLHLLGDRGTWKDNTGMMTYTPMSSCFDPLCLAKKCSLYHIRTTSMPHNEMESSQSHIDKLFPYLYFIKKLKL